MAKKDKLEEKKKELSEALEQFKAEHPDLTEDEIKLFEHMIEDMISAETKGLLSRIKDIISDFLYEFILVLISSMIISGFFISQFVPEQKWVIFIVAGITSFILTLLSILPAMFTSSYRKTKRFILFIILMIFACLFNSNVFRVFESSAIWIIYILAISIIHIIFSYYIIKKRLAALRR